MTRHVRDATPSDAEACVAIYTPFVEATAVSFEDAPPTPAELAERIAAAQVRHAWLVLEDDRQVVGYAYGGTFRARPAYRWTTEVSAYVAPAARGSGVGRALYDALLPRLGARGFRTAVAGMTEPNEASTALHRACGFEVVGTLPKVGFKLGGWHDVTWFARPLGPYDDAAEPT